LDCENRLRLLALTHTTRLIVLIPLQTCARK
jgi:hypothetical protein